MDKFQDLKIGKYIKILKINSDNDYQNQKLKCLNVSDGQIYKVIGFTQNSIILKTQYKFNLHIRKDVFKVLEFKILDDDSPEVKITFFSN